MDLKNYQAELRHAYVRGGPGAVVSGLIWLAAGLTSAKTDVASGFYLLFFGGMLIFPISKLVLKLLFDRTPESRGNPGGIIVTETVVPMIGGLFAAWLLLPHRPEFAFPVASIAVGAHYFGFRTAYGDWTYWILGGTLCCVGTLSIVGKVPASEAVPYAVALVELLFGSWFIFTDLRSMTAEDACQMNSSSQTMTSDGAVESQA